MHLIVIDETHQFTRVQEGSITTDLLEQLLEGADLHPTDWELHSMRVYLNQPVKSSLGRRAKRDTMMSDSALCPPTVREVLGDE